MDIALTHQVSPRIVDCELTYLDRQPIDYDRAVAQHNGYNDWLRRHGLQVIELNHNPDLPDSVFVEDTAVVVDEVAVMTTMGIDSRRPEVPAMRRVLAEYRPVKDIASGANLEGGDVVRIGRRFFVGLSTRSDRAGVASLAEHLKPHGYEVIGVEMKKALHLKSAASTIDGETVLINREFIDDEFFKDYKLIDIPPQEPKGANILKVADGTIMIPTAYPRTIDLLIGLGQKVEPIDITELLKAESGVTCSSVIFKDLG